MKKELRELFLKNCISKHYCKRYIKFIEFVEQRKSIIGYIENHHVVPMASQIYLNKYKKYTCKVSGREHYLLHWILAKMFGNKMWYAFNMMKRIIIKENKNSVLYEQSRKYVSKLISKNNKGKKRTKEFSQNISKRFIGKVTVKDKNGNTFMISITDPRYIRGELVFHKTGWFHKKSTLKKMRENSGIIGKKCYNNSNIDIYLSKNEDIPQGFNKGSLNKGISKEYLKNSKYYHNSITHEEKRFKNIDDVPNDWVLGRKESFINVAFNFINSNKIVVDIRTGITSIVNNEEYKNCKFYFSASSLSRARCFVYKNKLFRSWNLFNKYCKSKNIYSLKRNQEHSTIVKLHHNMKNTKNLIEGLTYKDNGYRIYKLLELKNIELKKYEIYR